MTRVATQFGPYELGRRLGVGGMAETFVATRRGDGGFTQRVCLKRILPAYENDPAFVKLFMREARVSARLRHSNIAQVLDFGVVGESHFLALELIEGMDLRALLRSLGRQGKRLSPGLVVHLAHELGRALDFAHAADDNGTPAGVVHRDISSSNVLLSRAGEIKLSDFGIAKAVNQPGTVQSGVIKGKVPYMAPEYATTGTFDARSDLFSLGVTLYECLVGRRPFDASSDVETLKRIVSEQFDKLVDIGIEAPAPLLRAIDRLLSANPEDRFVNAGAFLDALAGTAPPPASERALGALVVANGRTSSAPPPKDGAEGTLALPQTDSDHPTHRQPAEGASPQAQTRTRIPTADSEDD